MLIRKISDSWINSLPVITTPIGSEGMYLEAYDFNWALERVKMPNEDVFGDGRFYKPVNELPKSINSDLSEFYDYLTDQTDCKLSFGGLFDNYG